jgi:MFS family permease
LLPTFRALRHRNFRLFWSGLIISMSGTWLQNTAQGWLVYDLTGSTVALGVVGFATFIPITLFALVGGTVADHFQKRLVITITQTIMMLQALVIAVLILTGAVQVWHIVVLAFFYGTLLAFEAPSRQSFFIELVGKDDLLNAIALSSTAFNLARIIGPTIAGLLIAAVGTGICFLLNSFTFLPMILLLLFAIRAPHRPDNNRNLQVGRNLADGLRYVRDHKEVWSLILLVALGSVFGISFVTLMPAVAKELFGAGPKGYSTLLAFTGAGSLVGAIMLATFGHKLRKGRYVVSANVLFPLGIIGLAVSPKLAVACAFVAVIGGGIVSAVATTNTLIQTTVSDEFRGRVMSVFAIAFVGMFSLGSLISGFLAAHIGVALTLIAGAGVCLVGALWLAFAVPEVRRMV